MTKRKKCHTGEDLLAGTETVQEQEQRNKHQGENGPTHTAQAASQATFRNGDPLFSICSPASPELAPAPAGSLPD